MSSSGYSSARLRPRRAGLRFTRCAHPTNGPIQHWSPRWIRHNISFTPLSNLYLNEVDKMLERAREVTRYNGFTVLEYARFADDLVILVSAHPNQRWLHSALEKRVREEFAKLEVEVNEEKSRRVDLKRGESFSFLGFDFWRVRSRAGRWMPLYRPRMKKRTALLGQVKVV